MYENKVKMLAVTAAFGSLAIVLSFLYFSFPPWGDVTPASTPISIISTVAPMPVGISSSIIKGLGISMWTGDWFIEIPVAVGDALMAALTFYLIKRKTNISTAVVVGQLSRYLFTSGMVALYVGSITAFGVPSPLGGDVIAKFGSYATRLGMDATTYPFFAATSIVWLARFPAMTLSILLNSVLSVIVIRSAKTPLKALARYFWKD